MAPLLVAHPSGVGPCGRDNNELFDSFLLHQVQSFTLSEALLSATRSFAPLATTTSADFSVAIENELLHSPAWPGGEVPPTDGNRDLPG